MFVIYRDLRRWTEIRCIQNKTEIWVLVTQSMLQMAQGTTMSEKWITEIQEISKTFNKMEDVGEEVTEVSLGKYIWFYLAFFINVQLIGFYQYLFPFQIVQAMIHHQRLVPEINHPHFRNNIPENIFEMMECSVGQSLHHE